VFSLSVKDIMFYWMIRFWRSRSLQGQLSKISGPTSLNRLDRFRRNSTHISHNCFGFQGCGVKIKVTARSNILYIIELLWLAEVSTSFTFTSK